MSDQYTAGVVKEKLDTLKAAADSHHRRIGAIEVKNADQDTAIYGVQREVADHENDIRDARELADKASKELGERLDDLATSIRNTVGLLLAAAAILVPVIWKG